MGTPLRTLGWLAAAASTLNIAALVANTLLPAHLLSMTNDQRVSAGIFAFLLTVASIIFHGIATEIE